MAIPVRVLILEDSEDDALLILRELRKGGFEPASSGWRRARPSEPRCLRGAGT